MDTKLANNMFADALNKIEAEVGIEDGHLYFTDGNGTVPKAVDSEMGQIKISQTNSGPDITHHDVGLGIRGYHDSHPAPIEAVYIDNVWVGV